MQTANTGKHGSAVLKSYFACDGRGGQQEILVVKEAIPHRMDSKEVGKPFSDTCLLEAAAKMQPKMIGNCLALRNIWHPWRI